MLFYTSYVIVKVWVPLTDGSLFSRNFHLYAENSSFLFPSKFDYLSLACKRSHSVFTCLFCMITETGDNSVLLSKIKFILFSAHFHSRVHCSMILFHYCTTLPYLVKERAKYDTLLHCRSHCSIYIVVPCLVLVSGIIWRHYSFRWRIRDIFVRTTWPETSWPRRKLRPRN